jgi:hypothetical protein
MPFANRHAPTPRKLSEVLINRALAKVINRASRLAPLYSYHVKQRARVRHPRDDCHSAFRCDERRSLKTGWIVAHTRRATMRQPHYPPVSGLCRRWLPTTRLRQGDLRPGEMGLRVSLHGSNSEPLMSALGQKQTCRPDIATSALPPKADVEWPSPNVRFVPKAAVSRCSTRVRKSQSYSITSSARARTVAGMLIRSDFAVLRLIRR